MSSIELKGVSKRYGAVEVIPRIDLSFQHGEFAVLVGPSGCGQSTLLRMIPALQSNPGRHTVTDGTPVNHLDASQRGIAMVFQSYALYPHMTVRENIGFGLKMMKRPRLEIDQQVEAVARTLHLDALLERRPKDLSGGQRQRVAIGRAIVRAPEVFLFDEPLSNLDAVLLVEMRLEIARLHKRLGSTMVYVTHDQVEAMTLADKIAVMRSGRVEQFGTPRQLFADPDNTFVAGFIGAPVMNFVRAEVTSQDGSEAISVSPSGETVSFRTSAPLGVGRKVLLGVRPQHVELADDGPFAITADVVEAIGTETNIFGSWFGVDGFTITCSGSRAIASQDQVRFALPAASIFVFDAETGLRLR